MKNKTRNGPSIPWLLLLIGVVAIITGAAMIYPPAGFLVGGVLSIIGAVIMLMGGEETGDKS